MPADAPTTRTRRPFSPGPIAPFPLVVGASGDSAMATAFCRTRSPRTHGRAPRTPPGAGAVTIRTGPALDCEQCRSYTIRALGLDPHSQRWRPARGHGPATCDDGGPVI